MENNGPIYVIIKVGGEMKIPARPLFSSFPKFRIVEICKDNKTTNTSYWPNAGSLPSTHSPKHIRLINLDWNKVQVKMEYDETSKMIKVLSGNVDSVKIRID